MTYSTIGHVIAFAILIVLILLFGLAYWIITDCSLLEASLTTLFIIVASVLVFIAATLLSS